MIEILKSQRQQTCQALADAIAHTASFSPTEIELRDVFHQNLSSIPDVTPEGWYQPPPLGLIVVIANPPAFDRLNQPSFRSETAWPSAKECLTDESIIYGYGSRVHIPTGAIGDIACTLYRGNNSAIKEHIRKVWSTTVAIANSVELGMRLCDIYACKSNN